MKRLSLLISVLLYVSTSIGMVQDNLKTSLDQLVVRLQALERAIAPSPVPGPTPPSPKLPKAKEKDPLKQMVAQFIGSLTPEQRTEFEQLSPEDKTARLAQAFTQIKTTEPVAPSPTASPEPEPIEPGEVPAPPAPPAPPFLGAPGAPPPPSLGIGIKAKPAIAAVPTLPILTVQQLASKSADEKARSDAAFLALFKDLADSEYLDFKRFEQSVKKAIKDLRAQEVFLKRAELDALVDDTAGLFAVLKKDFSVDPAAKDARLQELYKVFTEMRTELLLQPFAALLHNCLFDYQLFSMQQLEVFVISSISCQRKAADPKSGEIAEAAQRASDQVFIGAWRTVTTQEEASFVPDNALNRLMRSLNFLRINPAFMLFDNMLWQGPEGSTQRGLQVAKKISPLLVMLQNPRNFFSKAEIGVIELKRNAARHLFDLSVYEQAVSSNSVKAALAWQLAHTKPVITQSLPDYVLDKLQKVTSLTQMQSLLKSVANIYHDQLGNLEILIKNLQEEFGKPVLNQAAIITGFGQLAQKLPAQLVDKLKDIIESDAKDKMIVSIVTEAAKVRPQFKERVLAATQGMPEFHNQLQQALNNLYRTPRDVYLVIYKAVKNKKLLSDNKITVELFYDMIKPYGILLHIFEYFALRYDQVKDDPARVQLNLNMLLESLQVLNNAKKYFDPKTADYKKLKGLKMSASSSIEQNRALLDTALAPVILDIDTNAELLGSTNAGYYSDQLSSVRNVQIGTNLIEKMGIYENLDPLLGMVQNGDTQGVIAYLAGFVEKAQGIDVKSEQFVALMNEVQAAIAGTFKKE